MEYLLNRLSAGISTDSLLDSPLKTDPASMTKTQSDETAADKSSREMVEKLSGVDKETVKTQTTDISENRTNVVSSSSSPTFDGGHASETTSMSVNPIHGPAINDDHVPLGHSTTNKKQNDIGTTTSATSKATISSISSDDIREKGSGKSKSGCKSDQKIRFHDTGMQEISSVDFLEKRSREQTDGDLKEGESDIKTSECFSVIETVEALKKTQRNSVFPYPPLHISLSAIDEEVEKITAQTEPILNKTQPLEDEDSILERNTEENGKTTVTIVAARGGNFPQSPKNISSTRSQSPKALMKSMREIDIECCTEQERQKLLEDAEDLVRLNLDLISKFSQLRTSSASSSNSSTGFTTTVADYSSSAGFTSSKGFSSTCFSSVEKTQMNDAVEQPQMNEAVQNAQVDGAIKESNVGGQKPSGEEQKSRDLNERLEAARKRRDQFKLKNNLDDTANGKNTIGESPFLAMKSSSTLSSSFASASEDKSRRLSTTLRSPDRYRNHPESMGKTGGFALTKTGAFGQGGTQLNALAAGPGQTTQTGTHIKRGDGSRDDKFVMPPTVSPHKTMPSIASPHKKMTVFGSSRDVPMSPSKTVVAPCRNSPRYPRAGLHSNRWLAAARESAKTEKSPRKMAQKSCQTRQVTRGFQNQDQHGKTYTAPTGKPASRSFAETLLDDDARNAGSKIWKEGFSAHYDCLDQVNARRPKLGEFSLERFVGPERQSAIAVSEGKARNLRLANMLSATFSTVPEGGIVVESPASRKGAGRLLNFDQVIAETLLDLKLDRGQRFTSQHSRFHAATMHNAGITSESKPSRINDKGENPLVPKRIPRCTNSKMNASSKTWGSKVSSTAFRKTTGAMTSDRSRTVPVDNNMRGMPANDDDIRGLPPNSEHNAYVPAINSDHSRTGITDTNDKSSAVSAFDYSDITGEPFGDDYLTETRVLSIGGENGVSKRTDLHKSATRSRSKRYYNAVNAGTDRGGHRCGIDTEIDTSGGFRSMAGADNIIRPTNALLGNAVIDRHMFPLEGENGLQNPMEMISQASPRLAPLQASSHELQVSPHERQVAIQKLLIGHMQPPTNTQGMPMERQVGMQTQRFPREQVPKSPSKFLGQKGRGLHIEFESKRSYFDKYSGKNLPAKSPRFERPTPRATRTPRQR